MDYFKNYGLTDNDINDIIEYVDNDDMNNYYINELDIIDILNYFKEVGIINLKDILKYKSNIFYEKVDNIKRNIESRKDAIKLINEDVVNFELIGY